MCLAVPAKIISIKNDFACVEIYGNLQVVNISLIEEPKLGEFVLLHAGFAIEKVDASLANEMKDLEGIG